MIYLSFIRFNFFKFLTYRSLFFFTILRRLIELLCMILFWHIITKNNGVQNWKELMTYFMIAGAINEITMIRSLEFSSQLKDLVQSGGLVNYLLKPTNTLASIYSLLIGSRGLNNIVSLFLIIIGLAISSYELSFIKLTLFVVLIIFASALSFFLSMIIGTIAFYSLKEMATIKTLAVSLIRVTSGFLIPLSFMPENLKNILLLSPFPYTVYGPIRLLESDHIDSNTLNGIFVTVIWLVVLYIIVHIFWNKSLKHYEASGL